VDKERDILESPRIITCKVCDGTGRFSGSPFSSLFPAQEVCPACGGAGEFEIAFPIEKAVPCKFCSGKGVVPASPLFEGAGVVPCPACKGIGLVERPIVGTERLGTNKVSVPQSPRLSRYDYDVAVSYASEDTEIVEKYCAILKSRNLRVFYDKYEQVNLWGKDLYDKLDEIYRKKALYCVIFISKHYAAKVWTNHERKSAQARALQENREYILPVRLDDTEIPGISPTVCYVNLRETSIEKLAQMTIEKVNSLKQN